MRRLVLAWLLVLACASPGTPPGGAIDKESPELKRVRPDTNATQVRANAIDFEFDEVVSERPTGASSLAALFQISPMRGEPRISWRRNRISVSQAGGLRPNTTYTVTLLPGITDLSNNRDSIGRTLVFSTGPSIDGGQISGVVFDWVADRAAPRAFVEAILLPDSVRFVATSDSAGRYTVGHLPQGRFLLRATLDANRNRISDPRELFDTATVTLADTLRRDMLAFLRDTVGPGIQTITIRDSLSLRVLFDRAIDTAFVITPDRLILKTADSAVVQIVRTVGTRDFDKQREDSVIRASVQDSVRRLIAQDSVRRVTAQDSVRRADSLRAAGVPAVAAIPPGARGPSRRPAPIPPARPRDSTRTEAPLTPSVRIPSTEILIFLARPLQPATTYKLRAEGMRSILGTVRTSERTITTPKRQVVDSTRRDSVRRDSAGRAIPPVRRDSAGRVIPPVRPDSIRPPDASLWRSLFGDSRASPARR